MKTIFQNIKLKQDGGNYKIVTGNFLMNSPLRGDDLSLKRKAQSLKLKSVAMGEAYECINSKFNLKMTIRKNRI
jgi:hypothetical protein